MDCDYWIGIVNQLRDITNCWQAAHILSTLMSAGEKKLSECRLSKGELDETNLGMALKCVSENEIIEGAIYAYRDWDAQPTCDLILAQFDTGKVKKVFASIKSPTSEMTLGIEGFLDDMKN